MFIVLLFIVLINLSSMIVIHATAKWFYVKAYNYGNNILIKFIDLFERWKRMKYNNRNISHCEQSTVIEYFFFSRNTKIPLRFLLKRRNERNKIIIISRILKFTKHYCTKQSMNVNNMHVNIDWLVFSNTWKVTLRKRIIAKEFE